MIMVGTKYILFTMQSSFLHFTIKWGHILFEHKYYSCFDQHEQMTSEVIFGRRTLTKTSPLPVYIFNESIFSVLSSDAPLAPLVTGIGCFQLGRRLLADLKKSHFLPIKATHCAHSGTDTFIFTVSNLWYLYAENESRRISP